MEVSGQLHAPDVRVKILVPSQCEAGWAPRRSGLLREGKILLPLLEFKPRTFQPVAFIAIPPPPRRLLD